VELRFSEVLEDNETKRIDSEFFNKLSLIYDKQIKNLKHYFLTNVVSGPFGSTLKSHSYLTEGVPFIRVENLKDRYTIKKDELVYISDANNELLKNSQLFLNDLVMSKVGNTIGLIARVDEEIESCNISENNLGIKLGEFDEAKKLFILVYLNCKYAQNLILRRISGNAQPKLNVGDMLKVPIPIFSNNFQFKIETIVKFSYQKLEESKALYNESEKLLLKELNLLDFKPIEESIAIKSLKESFGSRGRLDSEYYQPKYDDIIEKIKSYQGGFEELKTACKLKDKNHKPQENQYYQYIELSNIGNTGDITGFTYDMGQDLPSRARRIVKQNDVIISSIEGSLEKVALVTKEFHNSLCSTGFYVIDSKKINSETLLVLFKNKVFQQILKQNCSGTILTAINKDEFVNIIIPIIDNSIQIQIEEKIKKSFELKEESKRLLDLAKKAVEIAIERNEDEAMEYLNAQV